MGFLENKRSEYILVVEDYEDMSNYLGLILSEASYQVAYAQNGKEALELMDKAVFDLIISDVGMPEMDGYELLRAVREEKQLYIPFLFLTAHQSKPEILKALLLGVDAYVTKPFDSEELLARVRGLLFNNQRRKVFYAQNKQENAANITAETYTGPLEMSNSFRSRWLKELETILEKEISNSSIKIPELAFKMAVSERTFRNRIKEYTGLTPNEYIMDARMNRALYLLENQVYLTVAEVAYAVGIDHSSYFTRQFKERFGTNPSRYL